MTFSTVRKSVHVLRLRIELFGRFDIRFYMQTIKGVITTKNMNVNVGHLEKRLISSF